MSTDDTTPSADADASHAKATASPSDASTNVDGVELDRDKRAEQKGRAIATLSALTNGQPAPGDALDADAARSIGEFWATNATGSQTMAYSSPEAALAGRRGHGLTPGDTHDGNRNIDHVLGYPDPDEIHPQYYEDLYAALDLAQAVVDAPVKTTWRNTPEITDTPGEEADDADGDPTPFESDVADLLDTTTLQRGLSYYWQQGDRDCRLGDYSLLYYGFDDGRKASEAVNESALSDPADVRFVRPIKQSEVSEWDLAGPDDERDPGLPITYEIEVPKPKADGTHTTESKTVHYSRVTHITDDPDATRLLSPPALECILHRLIDYKKVVGAAAEMFWTGADRKFFFSNDTGAQGAAGQLGAATGGGGGSPDYAELEEHIRQMMNGLKPAIYADNMSMESIDGQEADPTGLVDVIYQAISAVTGIPQSVLKGNETGERATTQDLKEWYGKIAERQTQVAEVALIRPTLDLFIEYGIISPARDDEYEVEWPSLYEADDQEQADTRNANAQAIKRIENAAAVSGLPRQFLYEDVLEIEIPDDVESDFEAPQPAPAPTADAGGTGQDAPPADSPEQPSPDDDGGGDAGGEAGGAGGVQGNANADETEAQRRAQWNVMRARADGFVAESQ